MMMVFIIIIVVAVVVVVVVVVPRAEQGAIPYRIDKADDDDDGSVSRSKFVNDNVSAIG